MARADALPPPVFLGKNQRYKFREMVARLMVEIHKISPQLATEHAFSMDDYEILRRLRMYARVGTELSAAGPNSQSGQRAIPSLTPASTTAGRTALNPVSAFALTREFGPVMPESEKERLGRRRRFSPPRKGFEVFT